MRKYRIVSLGALGKGSLLPRSGSTSYCERRCSASLHRVAIRRLCPYLICFRSCLDLSALIAPSWLDSLAGARSLPKRTAAASPHRRGTEVGCGLASALNLFVTAQPVPPPYRLFPASLAAAQSTRCFLPLLTVTLFRGCGLLIAGGALLFGLSQRWFPLEDGAEEAEQESNQGHELVPLEKAESDSEA